MTQKSTPNKSRIETCLNMPKGYDKGIHIALLILTGYGILMIASASMGIATGSMKQIIVNAGKQTVFITIGYMVMCYLSNTFTLGKLKQSYFYFQTVVVMAMCVMCIAFTAVNGSHAWLRLNLGVTEFTIQPSEFAKVYTYLVMASLIADTQKSKLSTKDLVKRPLAIIVAFMAIILFIQKDFGSMMVLSLIAYISLMLAHNKKLKKWQFWLSVAFFTGIIIVIYLVSPSGINMIEHLGFLKAYQKKRFESAVNPFADPYGSGYQLIQSLIAFSDGGFRGRGFGSSVRKYMNFPEATNDFILAIVTEEFGFVGFLCLMFLYGVIIYRLLIYARKMKSEASKMVLVGSASYFLIHILLNVGGVTGLIPLTGVPLPLMSSGGSSAWSLMASVGLSQSLIAKYNREEREKLHAYHSR